MITYNKIIWKKFKKEIESSSKLKQIEDIKFRIKHKSGMNYSL
jgi:hypothetical protein